MKKTEKEGLWEKDLWAQGEVASYFRVVESTVKNWRDRGLLSYWQAPGSTRVLYYRDGIKAFLDEHTKPKKGGGKKNRWESTKGSQEISRGKPDLSATEKKEWRI